MLQVLRTKPGLWERIEEAQKKDYEKGYRNYRQAIKIVRTIADDIADEGLKKSYLSGEKIVSMADEIKKLSRILAQKKRTGV